MHRSVSLRSAFDSHPKTETLSFRTRAIDNAHGLFEGWATLSLSILLGASLLLVYDEVEVDEVEVFGQLV